MAFKNGDTMTKAIKPSEVTALKKQLLPNYVIEAFNELIVAYFNGTTATINQEQVIELMLKKSDNLTRSDIFSRHYLDVEAIYQGEGWEVFYNKYDCSSSYIPHYKFKAKYD
jgi:hypothetical protein